MRLLLAAGLLLLLPGCLQTTGSATSAYDGGSCHDPPKVATMIDRYDALFPKDVPAGEKPVAQVEVLEGGTLTATARWSAAAGAVRVVYDGPPGIETRVDGLWTTTVFDAPAGTYTLLIEGDPVALSGDYMLALTALPC